MSIIEAPNRVDPELVDIIVKTQRNSYALTGVLPAWARLFRSMAADRVVEIVTADRAVIVIPNTFLRRPAIRLVS
jgi:hypothetical protein